MTVYRVPLVLFHPGAKARSALAAVGLGRLLLVTFGESECSNRLIYQIDDRPNCSLYLIPYTLYIIIQCTVYLCIIPL